MSMRSARTVFLIALLTFGLIYASTRAAYAHNFGSDESASFLAKVQEIKVESNLVQSGLANPATLQWHLQKVNQYWTASDTAQIAERNDLLSKEIPAEIANLTTLTTGYGPDPSKVGQAVSDLGSYLSESVSVRIDPPQLQNLTVSALAIKTVLDEALNDYGNATGATSSLTDVNNMNMSSMSGSVASNVTIVNAGAYESSMGMVHAIQSMWSDLKAKTPSNVSSTAISNLDAGFTNLKALVDGKASASQIMELVHGTIHPNLIVAYGVQTQSSASAGGGSISGNMTGTGNMTMGSNSTMVKNAHLPHVLLAYVSQTGGQIHESHKASAPANSGGNYMIDTKYALTVSGTATSVADQSKSEDANVTLDLSTWKTEGRVVTLDVIGGSAVIGQDTMKVHSGVAAYVMQGHVLYVVALITPEDNPTLGSVQLLKMRAVLPQDENKLPLSSSDLPLKLSAKNLTMLGADWVMQLDGQVALS